MGIRQAETRPKFQVQEYFKYFSPYSHIHTIFCIQLQGRLSTPYSPMDLRECTDLRSRCPALELMKLQHHMPGEQHKIPFSPNRVGSNTQYLIVRSKTLCHPNYLIMKMNYSNIKTPLCMCPISFEHSLLLNV